MNGKQAKSLRKILGIVKPAPDQSQSGLETKQSENGPYLVFHQRKVPTLNMYRMIKRKFTRKGK